MLESWSTALMSDTWRSDAVMEMFIQVWNQSPRNNTAQVGQNQRGAKQYLTWNNNNILVEKILTTGFSSNRKKKKEKTKEI